MIPVPTGVQVWLASGHTDNHALVSIKTPEQMDLLVLHRVRSRLVGQRTGVINQIRGFLLDRGITVRQVPIPLRKALPEILRSNFDALSPRMINLIGELIQDWRRLDECIAAVYRVGQIGRTIGCLSAC